MSDAGAKLMSCVIKLNPYCFLVAVAVVVAGSFSNDDGDGNQDVKKSNRFITQNNNFSRASRFFVHFFTVLARLRRENALLQVLWRT